MSASFAAWTGRGDQTTLTAVSRQDDPSIGAWFLSDAERRNPASDIRGYRPLRMRRRNLF